MIQKKCALLYIKDRNEIDNLVKAFLKDRGDLDENKHLLNLRYLSKESFESKTTTFIVDLTGHAGNSI